MQKRFVKVLFDQRGTSRRNRGTGETLRAAGQSAMGKRQETLESSTMDGCGARNKTLAKTLRNENFCKMTTNCIDLNMYIVGAGA